MASRWITICLISFVIATVSNDARSSETAETYLFVQTARTAQFQDGVLKLDGIGPMTVFFSDRPERKVGYLTNAEFLDSWANAADSLASDPPNASLAFSDGQRRFVTVLELIEPKLDDSALSYRVKILEGDLPDDFAPVALFIDAGALLQLVAQGVQD